MVASEERRSCDVCVFGATGFTGKFVLKEVLSQASKKSNGEVRVGAAGRSKARVTRVVQECLADLKLSLDVAVIEADVKDENSLRSLASSSRILLNCVGPYRKFGPPVVKACVEKGTHYLDICGEPEFIEKCELDYGGEDGLAAKNECFVVSGCGFDSIPCDLGTLHNQETMREKGLIPSSVESFLTIKSGPAGAAGHYATWEALVLGFSSVKSLRQIRKALKERNVVLSSSSSSSSETKLPIGPKPKRAKGTFDPRVDAYTLPFLGSDASIVRRTQHALARSTPGFQPVHHSAMFTVKSKTTVGVFAIFGSVLNFLVKYKFGRFLLLKYPKIFSFGGFSHAGPSMKQIEGTSFEMTFFGKGKSAHSDSDEYKTLVTKISGPEPGYLACSTLLTQAALTVLQELGSSKNSSKLCSYGVRTTGELLFKTNYLDRLKQNGIGLQTLLSE